MLRALHRRTPGVQNRREHACTERTHFGTPRVRSFAIPDVVLRRRPTRTAVFAGPRRHRPTARDERIEPALFVWRAPAIEFAECIRVTHGRRPVEIDERTYL